MGVIDSLIVFVVSLLIGGLGIYVGARVITHVDSYSYAVVTAFVGALAWLVTSFLIGWIPFLGAVITLIVYLGVINWRYPGGWISAAEIALVAWIISLVVLYALAALGVFSFGALGVPGA